MSSVAVPQQTLPKRRRGLWIALFASLALNVFLVGWVSATWISDATPNPRRPASARADFHPRAARQAISEDQRRIVDRIWQERGRETRASVTDLRAAKSEL